MPKYSYSCPECGLSFDNTQSGFDGPEKYVPCHYCDGMARHTLSRPNVIFRGPGFSRRNGDPHLIRNPNHRNTDRED